MRTFPAPGGAVCATTHRIRQNRGLTAAVGTSRRERGIAAARSGLGQVVVSNGD